ncbi:hypothetical protein [Bradyrhizobium sp. SZCCHNR1039]|uniref:hypothetical protein n=1 Tax=Bradyrhizobium sp. SZCCHNR1039 TaxID=3057350 RepID=UPI002916BEFA|nr:hypothetical protein [Bradyrhizobium sp. SZCCHNR1039]
MAGDSEILGRIDDDLDFAAIPGANTLEAERIAFPAHQDLFRETAAVLPDPRARNDRRAVEANSRLPRHILVEAQPPQLVFDQLRALRKPVCHHAIAERAEVMRRVRVGPDSDIDPETNRERGSIENNRCRRRGIAAGLTDLFISKRLRGRGGAPSIHQRKPHRAIGRTTIDGEIEPRRMLRPAIDLVLDLLRVLALLPILPPSAFRLREIDLAFHRRNDIQRHDLVTWTTLRDHLGASTCAEIQHAIILQQASVTDCGQHVSDLGVAARRLAFLADHSVRSAGDLIEFVVRWIEKHRRKVHFLARAGKEMALDRRSLGALAAELGAAPRAAGRIP